MIIILTLIFSLLITLHLIKYKFKNNHLFFDYDTSGPQKFHEKPVPRIGGISIYFACVLSATILYVQGSNKALLLIQLLIFSLPAFLIGLIEDLTKKIGVMNRLFATLASACLAAFFLNNWITHIEIPIIDNFLKVGLVSILFTLVAITGLAHAYNLIDGFNGLASMVAMISLASIGYVAFNLNDFIIANLCLTLIASILGFFRYNYPRGLIFLGDGGAYLIGYLTATISILLVNRNPSVSPWFALLINIYPILETLFTIWRRHFLRSQNPSIADALHFHSLLYRRIFRWDSKNRSENQKAYLKNSKTSHILWFLSTLAAVPATIWSNSGTILQFFTLLFCISYILIYKAMVRFKTPNFLKKTNQ